MGSSRTQMNNREKRNDPSCSVCAGAFWTSDCQQSDCPNKAAECLKIGDCFVKKSGDYKFIGEVRAVFTKKSGAVRYVVENDDGILHIFSAANAQAPI